MTLIALAAGKGAPGVTTSSLVLAAVWPRPAVFAECDPAGGDVLFRLRRADGSALTGERGIVSLATALRVPGAETDLLAHTQDIDGGLQVLVGVASPVQANALAGSWAGIAKALASCDVDVVVDCGRLGGQVVVEEVLRVCDRLLLVCRATPAGVAHTRSALEQLRARLPDLQVSLLVIGGPDDPARVAEALRGMGELDVVGPLAFDLDAAAGLAGQWTRRLDRSALVVSARAVARATDARFPHSVIQAAHATAPDVMSEVG